MDDSILNAIEVFKARVKTKEDDLNRLKKMVNDMCAEAKLPPAYASVASESIATLSSIRSDHFYGQTLSSALRMYLEMRKGSGLSAAPVSEIYGALKAGGYKFETKDEENAKTSVRATLRKSSSVFHRLPNGDYGLLAWYPNAKARKDDEDDEPSDHSAKAPSQSKGGPSTVEGLAA